MTDTLLDLTNHLSHIFVLVALEIAQTQATEQQQHDLAEAKRSQNLPILQTIAHKLFLDTCNKMDIALYDKRKVLAQLDYAEYTLVFHHIEDLNSQIQQQISDRLHTIIVEASGDNVPALELGILGTTVGEA